MSQRLRLWSGLFVAYVTNSWWHGSVSRLRTKVREVLAAQGLLHTGHGGLKVGSTARCSEIFRGPPHSLRELWGHHPRRGLAQKRDVASHLRALPIFTKKRKSGFHKKETPSLNLPKRKTPKRNRRAVLTPMRRSATEFDSVAVHCPATPGDRGQAKAVVIRRGRGPHVTRRPVREPDLGRRLRLPAAFFSKKESGFDAVRSRTAQTEAGGTALRLGAVAQLRRWQRIDDCSRLYRRDAGHG